MSKPNPDSWEQAARASLVPDKALTPGEIRSRLIRSAVSSYGILLLRLLVGVFLTRILFLGLTRVDYGFWALLWSVFGYSLLLDFGFGIAMAKHVSQATVRGNWDEFNRRFNTVFFVSCALAFLVAAATLICLPLVPAFLRLEKPAAVTHQVAFLVFGLGTALSFPLGVFGEILRGLDRIPLRNNIQGLSLLSSFVLLASIVHWELGLPYMAAASVVVNLASNLAIAVAVKRLVPEFRLSWRLFDWNLLRSTLAFSVFAYVVMVSWLVILRTDQLIIAVFLSVALVAPYQVVWRLSFFFSQISAQMLQALGPIAATLFESRNRERLRETLFGSARVISGIATFLFPPLVIYIEPILKIWLHLDEPDAELCGLLLLTSAYVSVTFKSTTAQVLLMCRQERALAAATLSEAVLNLGLSIALCTLTDLGIVGVALGTLIPVAALSLLVYLPLTCKFASVSIGELVRRTYARNLLPGLLAALTYYLFSAAAPPQDLIELVLNAAPGAFVFAASFLYLGLRPGERRALRRLIPSTRSTS